MTITTLNEEMGTLPSILDAAGDSAWVIRHRSTGFLHTIAGNRRTAEHIVHKKAAEYGGSADDYIVEVWHVMQSPEDYDDIDVEGD